jgi:hypothetical protein
MKEIENISISKQATQCSKQFPGRITLISITAREESGETSVKCHDRIDLFSQNNFSFGQFDVEWRNPKNHKSELDKDNG